ncbi:MAG: CRTAC1 family protein [Pirellulales bacterium]|nr:CRTAC1 family protein [Pirellulales bacterium]
MALAYSRNDIDRIQPRTDHGLTKIMFAMGGNYGDLDNDGFLDFYLGTGYPDYEALMPNVMYHNRAGKKFEDVTFAGGFGHLQKGHGIAFADIDLDGDQEVIAQMGGFYAGDKFHDVIFDNPGFGNHWIKVQLIGTQSNRSAIGARIHIVIKENGKQCSIYKYVNSGGSFGANPLRQSIGLGKASKIVKLEVYWPTTDITQTFDSVPLDCVIEITEGLQNFKILDLTPDESSEVVTGS